MRAAWIVLVACGGGSTPPAPARPPPPAYASATAIAAPAIFARGAISTELPEFAITFTPDGATAYFDRATPDRSKLTIMESRFVGGVWQSATAVAFSTGEHRDVDPFVTPDGTRLYFSSNRPGSGAGFNTWYVERVRDGWGPPQPLAGPLSGEHDEVYVTAARDGTLYYQSNATGGGDLYRARGGVAERLSLGTDQGESNPAIAPDGTLLVFAAERPDGAGGTDLYASRADAAGWTPPRLLRAVSSPQADFAPSISPDGNYLFFTSERPGVSLEGTPGRPPGDIYQVNLAAALAE